MILTADSFLQVIANREAHPDAAATVFMTLLIIVGAMITSLSAFGSVVRGYP